MHSVWRLALALIGNKRDREAFSGVYWFGIHYEGCRLWSDLG